MARLLGKLTMKVLTVLVGIPVGIATKKAVARAWTVARPGNPPHDVGDRRARWGDVAGYAALAAAGTVTARRLTRHGAETTYRTLIGTEPPPPAPSKAQKKAAKAAAKRAGRDPQPVAARA